MKRLVVATGNFGKLREIRMLLGTDQIELAGLADCDAVRLPAEGSDYRTNAIEKARAVAQQLGVASVADDSGLEVEALGGRPGPHSARYGGQGLDDAGRLGRLLGELDGVPATRRAACFVCYAALVLPEGGLECVAGVCRGVIREQPSGAGGFGYDPVFQPLGERCTMAELSAARKNEISHRARAFGALCRTPSWASWLSA